MLVPKSARAVAREASRRQAFVILGVNSDTDRESLKKALEKVHITWRSFFDGSTSGPIARRWNINQLAWPTLFVLDGKGVIRRRFLGI